MSEFKCPNCGNTNETGGFCQHEFCRVTMRLVRDINLPKHCNDIMKEIVGMPKCES